MAVSQVDVLQRMPPFVPVSMAGLLHDWPVGVCCMTLAVAGFGSLGGF